MKIIWLTPEIPYPPNSGGRLVMFKRIEYLSRRNEIHLFCITDFDNDYRYKDNLEEICTTVNLYKRSKIFNIFKFLEGPFVCASRWIPKMKADIKLAYDNLNPDYVIVEFPQMLGNIADNILESGKVVLNQHNTEFITLRNISELYRNPLRRYIGIIESKRLESFEKRQYNKGYIKIFTFVSTEDKNYFESHYRLHNTLLVPIGTDVVNTMHAPHKDFVISYIGKMNYPPNIDAVVWFAKNVFNKLKSLIPNLKFYVVGKDPVPSVAKLAMEDNDIVVTGTVNDMDEYYDKTDLIVVPLFYGGGVKVKLLEALGHGKLVIVTDKGIEGTSFQNKQQLIVANTIQEYIDVCFDVYTNPANYNIYRENAIKYIEENYTWSTIMDKFENILLNDNPQKQYDYMRHINLNEQKETAFA